MSLLLVMRALIVQLTEREGGKKCEEEQGERGEEDGPIRVRIESVDWSDGLTRIIIPRNRFIVRCPIGIGRRIA
jgi:hypothetical protein